MNFPHSFQLPDDLLATTTRLQIQRVGTPRQIFSQVKTYGGFLWAIDSDGGVYRTSPWDNSLITAIADLPGTDFSSSFTIKENPDQSPCLYGNNKEAMFRVNLLTGKTDLLFKAAKDEIIISDGFQKSSDVFFLTQRNGNIFLRCIGEHEWDHIISESYQRDDYSYGLSEVNNSLWVVTPNKIVVFPNFTAERALEKLWSPRRTFITDKGVWYTTVGERQAIYRLSFEEGSIVETLFKENLPLTARVAANTVGGEIAIFLPNSVDVYEFGKNLLQSLRGIVDIQNPTAFVSPPLICWHDNQSHYIHVWKLGNQSLSLSCPVKDFSHLSQILIAYGCLIALTEDGHLWVYNFSAQS
jgi:hypothetical protein